MSGLSSNCEIPDYRTSVGAVLKELRSSQNLSRSQLAIKSGISVSRLGHIERGQVCPNEETIAQLAPFLGTTSADIWSRAGAAYQERVQLKGFLEDLGIPRENWEEFFALDPRARSAFVRSMQARLPQRADRMMQLHAIEDAIERNGLDDSLDLILAGISEHGLPPIDHMRASVELEEMPGDRAIFTDRLPISPVSVPVDWLYLFRASYGMDPPNSTMLKQWAETRRTAMGATLNNHVSRTIIPIERLEHYIHTGARGPRILLPPDLVAAHLVATIDLLRTKPSFQLGLSKTKLPLIYRIKGDHHVLVTVLGYVSGADPQEPKTTLVFSRPSVVKRFNEHFEREWARLPDKDKDQESIAKWLEKEITEVENGGER